jgi:hypothetical protein
LDFRETVVHELGHACFAWSCGLTFDDIVFGDIVNVYGVGGERRPRVRGQVVTYVNELYTKESGNRLPRPERTQDIVSLGVAGIVAEMLDRGESLTATRVYELMHDWIHEKDLLCITDALGEDADVARLYTAALGVRTVLTPYMSAISAAADRWFDDLCRRDAVVKDFVIPAADLVLNFQAARDESVP